MEKLNWSEVAVKTLGPLAIAGMTFLGTYLLGGCDQKNNHIPELPKQRIEQKSGKLESTLNDPAQALDNLSPEKKTVLQMYMGKNDSQWRNINDLEEVSKKQETSQDKYTISQAGINMIKKYEGFSSDAYKCPSGVWTIGYGDTLGVKPGDKITRADAEKKLQTRLGSYEGAVKDYVKVPLTQNQYDALTSLAYNIGPNAFKDSTLVKKLNAKDYQGAAKEFPRWNKGAGKVLPGLVKRRADEKALFEKK